jgi:hypothetical protein
VLLDRVARLDLPGDQLGLVHAFAEVRQDEDVGVGGFGLIAIGQIRSLLLL